MTSRSKSGFSARVIPLVAVLFGSVLSGSVMSADGAAMPANLRADVYSPGVFEVFWDRESEYLVYEIHDSAGELLGVTDGTSYFFDHDPAFNGPTASIEVVSLNVDGEYSDTANLQVAISEGESAGVTPPAEGEPDDGVTPPAETQDIFSIAGGRSVLKQLNELVLGNALNTEVLDRYRQIIAGNNVSELWEKGFVITIIEQDSYDTLSFSEKLIDCPDGGNYVVTENSSASGRNSVYQYEMNGCSFDGVVHTGDVYVNVDESNFYPDFAGSFFDYTLEYTDGRRITADTADGPQGDGVYSRNVNLLSLERSSMTANPRHLLRGEYTVTESDGNTTTVENALLEWENNSLASNCVQLSMRISAPWTNYQVLQVDTYNDDWEKSAICDDSTDSPYLSGGALSVSDGAGRSITLEPHGETGYNLMIADSPDSSQRQYDMPWAEDECVLLDDEAVNCQDAPPLY